MPPDSLPSDDFVLVRKAGQLLYAFTSQLRNRSFSMDFEYTTGSVMTTESIETIVHVRRILIIILIVTGWVANMLMICTVITKRLRRKGYGQYLACLAVAVILYLAVIFTEEVDGLIRDMAKHNLGIGSHISPLLMPRTNFSVRSGTILRTDTLTKLETTTTLNSRLVSESVGDESSSKPQTTVSPNTGGTVMVSTIFYYFNTPACRFWRFSKAVLPIIESWSIVCLSVERFLVVAMPRNCGHICSRNVSLIVIFAIISCAVASQSFILVATEHRYNRFIDKYCQTKHEYLQVYTLLTPVSIIGLQYGLPFLIVLVCNVYVLLRMQNVANELYSVHHSTRRNFQFFSRIAHRLSRPTLTDTASIPSGQESLNTQTVGAQEILLLPSKAAITQDDTKESKLQRETNTSSKDLRRVERAYSVKPMKKLSVVPIAPPSDSYDSIVTIDSPIQADNYHRLNDRIQSMPAKPGNVKTPLRRVNTDTKMLNEIESIYQRVSKHVTFGERRTPKRSFSMQVEHLPHRPVAALDNPQMQSNETAPVTINKQSRSLSSDGSKPKYLKRKATKILLSITFAFVIFHTPGAIVSGVLMVTGVRVTNLSLGSTILRLASEMATIGSFTMNLFFYIIWGKSYRSQLLRTLKRMFFCEKKTERLASESLNEPRVSRATVQSQSRRLDRNDSSG